MWTTDMFESLAEHAEIPQWVVSMWIDRSSMHHFMMWRYDTPEPDTETQWEEHNNDLNIVSNCFVINPKILQLPFTYSVPLPFQLNSSPFNVSITAGHKDYMPLNISLDINLPRDTLINYGISVHIRPMFNNQSSQQNYNISAVYVQANLLNLMN